jgi:hypothetical protein
MRQRAIQGAIALIVGPVEDEHARPLEPPPVDASGASLARTAGVHAAGARIVLPACEDPGELQLLELGLLLQVSADSSFRSSSRGYIHGLREAPDG